MAASRETSICTVQTAKKKLGCVLIKFGSMLEKNAWYELPIKVLLDFLADIENIRVGLPGFKKTAINIIESTQDNLLYLDTEKFRDEILNIIKYIQLSIACLKKADECRSTDTLRGDVEQIHKQVIEFDKVYGYLLDILNITDGIS